VGLTAYSLGLVEFCLSVGSRRSDFKVFKGGSLIRGLPI
jgi:hypothetical protein